jgi:hypothetical protein
MRLTRWQLDALKNIFKFLIQKFVGLLLIAIPFVLYRSGFMADDQSPGLAFVVAVPIGIWLLCADDIVF